MSIIQPYTCLRHVMENEHTECQLTDYSKVIFMPRIHTQLSK